MDTSINQVTHLARPDVEELNLALGVSKKVTTMSGERIGREDTIHLPKDVELVVFKSDLHAYTILGGGKLTIVDSIVKLKLLACSDLELSHGTLICDTVGALDVKLNKSLLDCIKLTAMDVFSDDESNLYTEEAKVA